MKTKKQRQDKILEIISEKKIERQEDIVFYLQQAGFDVTQATVSRDIRQMHLVKEMSRDGLKYTVSVSKKETEFDNKIRDIFAKSVLSVDFAMNIIVIKTLSGTAQAAASAVDSMEFPEVMGTIAGDDTIMIVTKSEADAKKLDEKLDAMR